MGGQVRLVWRVANNPRLFMCTFDTFVANLSASAVVTAVNDAYGATGSLRSVYPSQVVLSNVIYADETNDSAWEGSTAGSVTGTVALASPQVTYLVKKIGGPRKRQGRMFLPAVRESHVDELGNIPTVERGVMQNAVTAFHNALTAAGVVMKQKPYPGGQLNGETVTSLVVQSRVATQRRRLRVA